MSTKELRKISAEELHEIVVKHEEWLNGNSTGVRAVLSNADLSGANLSCTNLEDANLVGANLSGANLRECKLRSATLTCANLSNADLSFADLGYAYLLGANISGANLLNANLDNAHLPNSVYAAVGCGSINRTTYYDAVNDVVICGCWNDGNGNHLDSFKERVRKTYGEFKKLRNVGYPEHESDEACYNEYMQAIKFFESMRKLWKAGKKK